MSLKKYTRKAFWLMPGLSIKRWILIALLGLLFFVIGMALVFNLQPVTFAIKMLQKVALVIPANVSGPVVLGLGIALLYMGARRTYKTLYFAMGGSTISVLESLYQRHKLSQGPNIVAIGGGTGLSTLLRGVKHYTSNITAVVTVGDDGGSSGRLRKEQGVIPPGDIRNCIAALADEEQLITELFQYRFRTGPGLEGHSFGNLFLTALCRITGDMMSAIKESSKVLNIRGRVLPATLDNVSLTAQMEDGTVVHGESEIPKAKSKIRKLYCHPDKPAPLADVLKAIEEAELIILGPGSLYTSVIPNMLVEHVTQAVADAKAPTIYICNIMTQQGETDGYTVSDHVKAILSHCQEDQLIDAVFVNSWLPEALVQKYQDAGSTPVDKDLETLKEMQVEVVEKLLVDESVKDTVRHNPRRLAQAILQWYKEKFKNRLRLDDNRAHWFEQSDAMAEASVEKSSTPETDTTLGNEKSLQNA